MGERSLELPATQNAVDLTDWALGSFERLIRVMGPIREGGGSLGCHLSAASAAGASGGSGHAKDFSAAAARTHGVFLSFADRDAASERDAHAREARSALAGLQRRGVALNAIASMTQITARSLGLGTFDRYTADLRGICGELAASAEIVLAAIERVSRHDAETVTAAASAISALESLSRGKPLAAEAAKAAAVETDAADRHAARNLSEAAEDLNDCLTRELAGLIPLMQFADEFAQRLDHIGQIGAVARLEALQSAQLRSLAEDAETRLAEARRGFETLVDLACRVAAHFERTGAAGQLASRADERRSALDAAVQEAVAVERAAVTAQRGAEVLEEALRDAETAFGDLQSRAKDIGLAAINSILLASHGGTANGALTTLAAAVREQASASVSELQICRDALYATVARDCDGPKAMADAVDGLASALADARKVLETEERMAAERKDGTSGARQIAAEVAQSLDSGIDAIAVLERCPEALRDWAAAAGAATGAPDPEAADALREIYTMQRERQVHDAFLGREVAETEACATASADGGDPAGEPDIDDIFF